ncbi:hypothetical protein CONPUDRAFT_68731 [Coniophora puteana RWD-64-598 SS2]|uniref:DUF6533 domain-containing protein n=1 Tax=Coniophora puteana (strain RWD-64-598) TaxID=741705 RepID=A0A5M3N3Y5_CONPW|nr:uncharacterized protein CONPUDRAFT_68731 [Coniophora puteana RWD-64-598 SS2]EIW86130.1 hypothetical protein CONPUDRAFT_68731 [Coniophora puteana RWD-64-598 SS2]
MATVALTTIAYGKQSNATFDYCITFNKEVNLVWGRKWNAGRFVFMLARYAPFPGLALTLYGLLLIRTWAFWGCNRRLLIVLCVVELIFVVLAMFLTLYLNVGVKAYSANTGPNTCNFTTAKFSTIQFGFLVTFEIILLSLVIFRWIYHYRSVGNQQSLPIMNVVYRDAVLYVSIMIGFSLGNILNIAFAPQYFNEYLNNLQITIHSILAGRLFFKLREISDISSHQSEALSLTPFHAAVPVSTDGSNSERVESEDFTIAQGT